MKHFLIIFSLLLTSVSWSKDVDWNDLVKRDGLLYEKFTDEPFTGNVIGKEFGQLVNGKREGKWIAYHSNGQLKSKVNFKNDKHDGEFLTYYDNGHLRLK